MSLPELIVAGNWKMNGIRTDLAEIEAVRAGAAPSSRAGIWIFPPATLIGAAASLSGGTPVLIGAQDCHAKDSGAFTGDLSAPILKDAGAAAIIVGHSERRSGHSETSREVKAKAEAVLKAGLPVIVCLGETKGEREAGLAPAVCTRQLADSLPAASTPENTVIAYEPVWAIGTGLQATVDDITAIHAVLRAELGKREGTGAARWRILYGGSVSPANAAGIFESGEVDGVLVGGASLKAASFLAIIAAGAAAIECRKP
jgi:triosephosphate isomerase (TIM)